MRKKSLSDNQQTLIGDFLPEILVNSKKLDSSMKLILANIYKQHHIHPGLRTVFRTNISFLKDIEGKQPNDLLRPMNRLVTNGYISRTKPSQVNGTACEYSLNDKYYELLPEHLRVSKVTPNDSKVTSKVTPVTLEAKIDAMSLEINELKRQINELREQLDRVSKVTVTNSKVTTINNEQCGSRENKFLKRIVNNNLEPYGSRTGKDEELSLNFSSSSKTRSELESEHYDTVVLPQLRRIELWDENPEPEGYKQISIMSGWNDFPAAAEWFENDIRSKVSDEDWNRYLCIDFNRVKDKYIQIMKGHAA